MCNLFLHSPLPRHWTTALVFLLYKKKDVTDPRNYRPMSLLHSIYKIIATHIREQLSHHVEKHKIMHHSQHGGLAAHRTADHIYHIKALQIKNKQAYHLYIDFNKAFNSIPQQALIYTLQYYNLPTHLIDTLKHLYTHPYERPLINGQHMGEHKQIRGVRQGCPLSPLLFNLYLNIILHTLPKVCAFTESDTIHSYIDDILIRSKSPHIIQKAYTFFHTTARQLGLDMNTDKTELHAMNNIPHIELRIDRTTTLSTKDTNGKPHTHYKYLGIHLFTEDSPRLLHTLLINETNSYFNNLQSLPLTHSEYISLINTVLIPTLQYRLLAHNIHITQLHSIQSLIWRRLCQLGHLSSVTSPKDIYQRRPLGGLGLKHFLYAYHVQNVNQATRFLSGEGPASSTQTICSTLLSPKTNFLQGALVDSCYALNLLIHGFGPWNPCPVSALSPGANIYVDFQVVGPCLGTVSEIQGKKAKVDFSGYSAEIADKHNFSFSYPHSNPKPISHFSLSELSPTPNANQSLSTSAPAPPFSTAISDMSSLGATVHLPATHHVLLPSDLLSWNCTGALELLRDPLGSSAAWTYLDGSASFPHFGSAFAVFEGLNAHSCNVTASVSPLQSSGGSEFWALHLKLHHLQTHPNPNPLQFVLCDNANVVDCYRLAKHPDFNLFHKHPSGHWIKSFRSAIVQLSAEGVRVEVRWIKAHTGFKGNEIADAFAKWASFAILPTSLILPPPQKGSITWQGMPVLGKLTQKSYSHLLPKHMHTDIKLPESYDWFQSTSWFWSLPFKWSAGIFCTKGYNPHFRMEKHPCPACTHPHPMDPISVTALCTKAAHLQHEFIHAWPAPFQALVSEWWHTAPSARHKRNFIRTLLPIPLYNHLFSRMGLTKKSFNSQLRAALKERRDKTTKAVKAAKDWLIENPLCFPLSPAVSLNLWSMKGSPMGTSLSSAPKRKPQYHEPEPLPSKVTHKAATRTPKRGNKTPHRPLIQPAMRPQSLPPPQPFFSPSLWDFFQLRQPPEPPPSGVTVHT